MSQTPAPARAAADHTAGFTSLHTEVDEERLPVEGEIPDWLDGVLLRNGPALFDTGRRSVHHWFDGQAMLHRFALAGGTVSYRNRVLDTPASRDFRDRDRITYPEFATDPCGTLFGRWMSAFRRREPSANACVNIAEIEQRTVALTEVPLAVAFDPDTLESAGVVAHTGEAGGQTTTAHPLPDPSTGDLLNVVLSFGRRSEYRVFRTRGARREVIAAVPADHPGYLHSFAVTERHAVLLVHPLVVNPLRLLLRARPFIDNFRWRPELGTRVVVVDTATGAVRADLTAPADFAFHHVNAFDRPDGTITVDVCRYPDAGVVDALRLTRLRAGAPIPLPEPVRLVVDPGAGTVAAHPLGAARMELPRVAVAAGREHRFAWGCGAADPSGRDFLDRVVRLDTATGAVRTFGAPGLYPGEPVVVARPAPAGGTGAEDDGVVLSVALDATTGASCLLVLDAATLAEVGRARLPHAVPFGFHGGFRRSAR